MNFEHFSARIFSTDAKEAPYDVIFTHAHYLLVVCEYTSRSGALGIFNFGNAYLARIGLGFVTVLLGVIDYLMAGRRDDGGSEGRNAIVLHLV